jgi:hypothetical protein
MSSATAPNTPASTACGACAAIVLPHSAPAVIQPPQRFARSQSTAPRE